MNHPNLRFRTLLCLLILIFSGIQSWGLGLDILDERPLTQFRHRQWHYEEDLPLSRITDVHVSQNGYVWLASYDGLFRYNMLKFKRYSQEDSRGLRGGCAALYETPDGTLWIGGNGNGITRLNNETFTSWNVEDGLDFSVYRRLFSGPNGEIMFPGKTGLQTITGDQVVNFEFPGISDLSIREFVFADADTLFVGLWSGELLKISKTNNAEGFEVETLNLLKKPKQLVRAVAYDAKGVLWVGYASGDLVAYSQEDQSILRFESPMDYTDTTWHLKLDESGVLWGGSRHGLVRVIEGDYQYMDLDADYDQDTVIDISFTPDGALFTSGYSSGLHLFSIPKLGFMTEKDGLPRGSINAVAMDRDQTIWLGSDHGIYRISPEESQPDLFMSELFKNKQTRDLFWDSEQRLWACVAGHYLIRYNPKNQQIRKWTLEDGLPSNRVRLIQQVKDGTFWLATQDGLVHIKDDTTLEVYKNIEGVPSNYFLSICEDHSGRLWFGTAGGGLVLFDGEKFEQVTTGTDADAGVVFQIFEHHSGKIVASWVGGLIVVDPVRDFEVKLLPIGETQGEEVIFGVLEDTQDHYWMPGNGAIKQVEKSDFDTFIESDGSQPLEYKRFDANNALPTRDVRANARPCLDESGKLWIPLGGGVAIVDPTLKPPVKLPPILNLETVEVNSEQIFEIHSNQAKPIELDPGVKSILFTYSGIAFQNQEKPIYRYRLHGYDDWVETTRSEINYTNLPPREYVFEVVAHNTDGLTSDPVRVTVTIRPAFYQHPAFVLLMVVLLFVGVWGFVQWRNMSIRRQNRKLEMLVNQRTQELAERNDLLNANNQQLTDLGRDLSASVSALKTLNENVNHLLGTTAHDLRNSVGAIVSTAKLLEETVPELASSSGSKESAEEETSLLIRLIVSTGNDLLDRIHQLLDSDVRMLGDIKFEPEMRNIASIVKETVEMNQSNATLKSQMLTIEKLEDLHAKVDALGIKMAIDNYLSNAIKYSPHGGNIYISLSDYTKQDGSRWIRFSVKDEGPGLTEDDKKKAFTRFMRLSAKPTNNEHSSGIGLSVVRTVVQGHRGEVGVNSTQGEGAEFFFLLPKDGPSA